MGSLDSEHEMEDKQLMFLLPEPPNKGSLPAWCWVARVRSVSAFLPPILRDTLHSTFLGMYGISGLVYDPQSLPGLQ